jgi:hypothetical protein
MAKILVVTRDISEYLLYSVLVAALRAHGHNVIVVAEGLSLTKWVEAGEVCVVGIHPLSVLSETKPDLVLTGLGSPINLGESFGIGANEFGIKLGYIEDLWGVHTHSKALPDFVCTIDRFGQSRIQSYEPYQGKVPRVYITGSPTLDQLSDVKSPGEIFVGARNRNIVLFVGQDESTTPVLEGLVKALNVVNDSYILIPRFHPKRPDLSAKWDEILAESLGFVLKMPAQITTRQIMKIARVTVSCYSTALLEAAVLGSLPVSWTSSIGRGKMREALGGIERFPLVDSGCAMEVETPEEFQEAVLGLDQAAYESKIRHCQSTFRCDGKNTERVVAAIEQELVI